LRSRAEIAGDPIANMRINSRISQNYLSFSRLSVGD
jgi:hypothetical protein